MKALYWILAVLLSCYLSFWESVATPRTMYYMDPMLSGVYEDLAEYNSIYTNTGVVEP